MNINLIFIKNKSTFESIRYSGNKYISKYIANMLLENKDDINSKHINGMSYRKIGAIYGVSGNYIKDFIKGRIK